MGRPGDPPKRSQAVRTSPGRWCNKNFPATNREAEELRWTAFFASLGSSLPANSSSAQPPHFGFLLPSRALLRSLRLLASLFSPPPFPSCISFPFFSVLFFYILSSFAARYLSPPRGPQGRR